MITLKIFQADQGDCLLLNYTDNGKKYHILIDGGQADVCYYDLQDALQELKDNNEVVDLLILTHIDDDHIWNVLNMIRDGEITNQIVKRVWFNYGEGLKNALGAEEGKDIVFHDSTSKISAKKGITLSEKLQKLHIPQNAFIIQGEDIILEQRLGSARFSILSPECATLEKLLKLQLKKEESTKISAETDAKKSLKELAEIKFDEEKRIENKSSIAFIFELRGHRLLFLGDGAPSIVKEGLKRFGYTTENPLEVEYVKVAHHASCSCTDNELVQMLKCGKYIVSTNSQKGRPSKQCLSRIVAHSAVQPVEFLLNYDDIDFTKWFSEEEFEEYQMKFTYLNGQEIVVEE